MNYENGDPYVNLALSIIGTNRESEIYESLASHFKMENNRHPSVEEVSAFVGDWLIENHTIEDCCPVCQQQISVIPECEMVKRTVFHHIAYCPICQSKLLVR